MMACSHGVVGDCHLCERTWPASIASADCPICGWREHDAELIVAPDTGLLESTYLTCRACGNLSVIHHA